MIYSLGSMTRRTTRSRRAAGRPDAARRAILAAFFLSGFAGLMHQVIWAKLLVRLIGTTAVSRLGASTRRADWSSRLSRHAQGGRSAGQPDG